MTSTRVPNATVIANERELISRILSGETDVYYDLIAPYQRMVYVSAFSLLRNEAEAEDCAQEAFLKAFRHLADFKGESKFGSWLVRVAINEAKLRFRKARPDLYESLEQAANHEDGEYVPQSLGDWRDIPSEALERKQVRCLLEKAINGLSPIYRQVFVLRDVQGLNVADTAQLLNVSESVVRTRLVRARLRMRDLLAPAVQGCNVFSRPSFRKGRNPWL